MTALSKTMTESVVGKESVFDTESLWLVLYQQSLLISINHEGDLSLTVVYVPKHNQNLNHRDGTSENPHLSRFWNSRKTGCIF